MSRSPPPLVLLRGGLAAARPADRVDFAPARARRALAAMRHAAVAAIEYAEAYAVIEGAVLAAAVAGQVLLFVHLLGLRADG